MIKVAILTISDSASQGARADLSGPALRQRCEELQWPVTAAVIVRDEVAAIRDQLLSWLTEEIATVILTTGGTGVSPRDHTPEATRHLLEKDLPGVAELMRSRGLEQTPFSVLSRGLAGTSKRTFLVNLPGAPKGAVQSLSTIEHLIPHIVDLLHGKTEH